MMCKQLHDGMFSITLYVSLQFTIDGLIDAARNGDLNGVKAHINGGVDINGKDFVSLYNTVHIYVYSQYVQLHIMCIDDSTTVLLAQYNYLNSYRNTYVHSQVHTCHNINKNVVANIVPVVFFVLCDTMFSIRTQYINNTFVFVFTILSAFTKLKHVKLLSHVTFFNDEILQSTVYQQIAIM